MSDREPMTHDLKIWPVYFEAVCDGRKTWEVRGNDRDFREGDTLHLREWIPVKQGDGDYTGRAVDVLVTYCVSLPDQRSVGMSIAPAAPPVVTDGVEALQQRFDALETELRRRVHGGERFQLGELGLRYEGDIMVLASDLLAALRTPTISEDEVQSEREIAEEMGAECKRLAEWRDEALAENAILTRALADRDSKIARLTKSLDLASRIDVPRICPEMCDYAESQGLCPHSFDLPTCVAALQALVADRSQKMARVEAVVDAALDIYEFDGFAPIDGTDHAAYRMQLLRDALAALTQPTSEEVAE